MKICPVCGKPVEEEWTVCPYCGAPLEESDPGPRYEQAPSAAPMGRDAEPPTLQWMRQMICSPLYLAGAIGHSCMVLFTLVSTFRTGAAAVTETAVSQLVGNAYGVSSWLDGLYSWLPVLFSASVGSALVGQLPNILVAIGLWMLYISASDPSGTPLKTAGLSLIRGVQIFQLVLLGLVALLLLVAFAVMMATLQLYDLEAVLPIGLMLLVLLVVILAVGGLYYGKLIVTINSFRRTIWTGKTQGTISLYVAVLSALGGVLPLFRVLIGEIFSSLASIGGATAGIAFAILLFRCRDEWEQTSVDAAPPETFS